MEENNYGINWIGLCIKVVVFALIVLLAIWLISKITIKNKGLSFEENNQKFQDATVEYFKKNLPKEEKKVTVSLKQLINEEYIDELVNEKGKTCNPTSSKAQIEAVADYYSIKTTLVCEDEIETKYIKLGNEECSNCDIKVDGLQKPEQKETEEEQQEKTSSNTENSNTNYSQSSSTNNISSNNASTQNQTILYEYVKDVEQYSEWRVGTVKGDNIENSTKKVSYSKYCKNTSYTYRTVSYVTKKSNMQYNYRLELRNIYNVDTIRLSSTDYFGSSSDYTNYINNKYKDLEMVGDTGSFTLPSANTIRNSSMDSSNFTFTVGRPIRSNGKYYIDISVRIKNFYGVVPYYNSSVGDELYYVPIKFTIDYTNENTCVTDETDNSENYRNYTIVDTWNKTVDIYRYKNTVKEYKYSSATSLDGYTKTGKTKIAS